MSGLMALPAWAAPELSTLTISVVPAVTIADVDLVRAPARGQRRVGVEVVGRRLERHDCDPLAFSDGKSLRPLAATSSEFTLTALGGPGLSGSVTSMT